MEDNSAVVTLANTETCYAKKCKHFLMVLNYIKEQISLGQIEARSKIYGKLNNADLHTKPLLRSSAFRTMAHKILGQPPPIEAHLPPTQTPAEKVSHTDMDTSCHTENASRNNVSIKRRLLVGTFVCAVLGTLCSKFCVPVTVLDVPDIIWNIFPNNIWHIFLISDL